jgi:hypothetical protein
VTIGDIIVDSNTVDASGSITRKVVISFSVATSEPVLHTAESISEVLELTPPLGGKYGAAVGEWLQADKLRISVSECVCE